MNFKQAVPEQLYLGIDGGGSKCKARIYGAGREGVGLAGPANPFQNLEQAKESILSATDAALADAGLPGCARSQLIAGVGLAGVNVPRFFQLMSQWQHPFSRMFLTTDIHIACLSAHGGENGAVIVAGTGSVGYACINGSSQSFGAHGFPFGDKGSGAWMGLEVLKAALLAMDELGPATDLLQAVEQQLGVNGLDIITAMAGARTRDYGALAPLAFAAAEAGDPVATGIIQEGAAYLDAMAGKLLDAGATSFCMLGGLSPRIQPWMRDEITRHIVQPQEQPDIGAVLYAINCDNEQRRAG